MIALFELFLCLTFIYDIRRKMQIYGAHVIRHNLTVLGRQQVLCRTKQREHSLLSKRNPRDLGFTGPKASRPSHSLTAPTSIIEHCAHHKLHAYVQ